MVGFPLLLIPLAIFNIIVFLMPGVSLSAPVFTLALMSGVSWTVTLGDIFLAGGICAVANIWATPLIAAEPTAKEFLDRIYQTYVGKDAPGILVDKPANIRSFTPALRKLMAADATEAEKRGEVGNLDGDPLVDAQEWDITSFTVAMVANKGPVGRSSVVTLAGRNADDSTPSTSSSYVAVGSRPVMRAEWYGPTVSTDWSPTRVATVCSSSVRNVTTTSSGPIVNSSAS